MSTGCEVVASFVRPAVLGENPYSRVTLRVAVHKRAGSGRFAWVHSVTLPVVQNLNMEGADVAMAAAKSAVKELLARRGIYAIKKAEPFKFVAPAYAGPEVMSELNARIDAMAWDSAPDDGIAVWSSPDALKSYLRPSRIHMYHEVVRMAEDAGVSLDGKTVLDVGTCSGYLLLAIEQRHPTATLNGCDFYQGCVDIASKLVPQATVFKAGIADLDPGTTYDAIFCTEVLEHILDTETPIPTLLQSVKPGGALVLTVPQAEWDYSVPLATEDGNTFHGHVNSWSIHSWRFYLDRLLPDVRKVTGTLGGVIEGDGLYAVLFKG
jgi:protein-L-isoaspartate O-methyltransferase